MKFPGEADPSVVLHSSLGQGETTGFNENNNNINHNKDFTSNMRSLNSLSHHYDSDNDRCSTDNETVISETVSSGYISKIDERQKQKLIKQHDERLVSKNGDCNINITHVHNKRTKYFVDLFSTMLDLKWRYNIVLFLSAFIISWILFALIWWIILFAHGDHHHIDDAEWTKCMYDVYDFPTALLFSIETQHTIGYGSRGMESKCPEAFVLMMLQSVFGAFMQCLVTGFIFAKIVRPKNRGRTISFSRNAVICQRDDDLCLSFRIGDMRKSHIITSTVTAIMVRKKQTPDGEIVPVHQIPFSVKSSSGTDDDHSIFLAWPATVVHRIDENSPLWKISADQLHNETFEIIIVLEGCIEASGMTIQLRTSYLPSEILWGHHLSPLMTYRTEDGLYSIDFTQFHNTVPIDMPACSAHALANNPQQAHENPTNFAFKSAAGKKRWYQKKRSKGKDSPRDLLSRGSWRRSYSLPSMKNMNGGLTKQTSPQGSIKQSAIEDTQELYDVEPERAENDTDLHIHRF